jgi:Protein of unknown function (DUF2804)
MAVQPYRGEFGHSRPPQLRGLALPPDPMPPRHRTRPLKAWRCVGIFSTQLMVCAAQVRVGPARQAFWALWDREHGSLYERTRMGRGDVELATGSLRIGAPGIIIAVDLSEAAGIETVCPTGASYAWTRKQGGIPASGTVTIGEQVRPLTDARAIVDDTAAFYERHTHWRWCAGVGTATDGRALAWNLVTGVNDPLHNSERTIWIDGVSHEPPPQPIDPELTHAGPLRFTAEATRRRAENRLLVRSRYRQPFGTFSGSLPGGPQLATGLGVMEDHDVWW